MIELKIKDINGVWHTADTDPETKFAMNYQINDIASIERRNGSLSLTIKLPKTRENSLIFGFSHLDDSFTSEPYRNLECALISNGTYLTDKGSVIKILRITDYYECQILSNLITFYDLIKNTALADIDLGTIEHDNAKQILLSNPNSDNVLYCFAEFTKQNNLDWTIVEEQLQTPKMLPFYKLIPLVTKVLNKLGYSINISGLQNQNTTELLRIGNYQKGNNSFAPFIGLGLGEHYFNFMIYPTSTSLLVPSYQTKKYMNINSVDGSLSFYAGQNIILENNLIRGYIEIVLRRGVITNSSPTYIYSTLKGENIANYSFNDNNSHFLYFGFDGKLYNNYGDAIDPNINKAISTEDLQSLKIFATNNYDYGGAPHELSLTINVLDFKNSNDDNQQIPIGGIIPISKNLGYQNVSDLIKFFVELYGLLIYVDEQTKTVYFNNIKKIYDNIPNAFDFTEKIDRSEQERIFELDNYARKNIINFKENELYINSDFFNIDNQKLSDEKVILTFPTKSTKDFVEFVQGDPDDYVPYASISDIEVAAKDDEKMFITLKFDTKTPCVITSEKAYNYAINDGKLFIGIANILFSRSINIKNDMINNWYNYLTNKLLPNTRILTAKFNLTDQDIQKWNTPEGIVTPVFLSQTGQYYYINKIMNYQSGQLSKVELVRL